MPDLKNPSTPEDGIFLARCLRPGIGPCIAAVRNGELVDITSCKTPTARDIFELADPAGFVKDAPGEPIGEADKLAFNANEGFRSDKQPWLLAPCDLQVIKACGVTFAGSMIERVIEERAEGDPDRAEEIRSRIGRRIGAKLLDIEPGSESAAAAKGRVDRRGALVAIPGSRNRSRCRDIYQISRPVRCRNRFANRDTPGVNLEQSRT